MSSGLYSAAQQAAKPCSLGMMTPDAGGYTAANCGGATHCNGNAIAPWASRPPSARGISQRSI